MKSRVAVIIPALNEALTIKSVLDKIISRGFIPVVVDDGSTDETIKIAESFKDSIVIKHSVNIGYEGALNSGFTNATDLGFELIATFDADDQLDVDDIQKFVNYLDKENLDLVIGIRGYKNRYSEYLVSYYTKYRFNLVDPLCGLKLYRVESAKSFLPFDSLNLVGMELCLKMVNAGKKFGEIPIKVKKRIGQSRYGSSLKGEYKILKSLLKVFKNI